jgi:plastocyanin
MRRSLALLIAAAALALVAVGCGSDNSSSTSTASSTSSSGGEGSGGGGGGVTVDMKNIQFSPKDITVNAGQTIRWQNLDTVDHDVVADSGADFKSDQFGKGGTFEYKPTKAGEIDYECTLHPGMTGKITVR